MFLLYGLQSPINIGQILRTSEQFGLDVTLYDAHQTFNEENMKTISDFSCGALKRKTPKFIHDYASFRQAHRGRVIATCLSPRATVLPDFLFRRDDMILLGNEYDGLPEHIIEDCDDMVYIPLPPAILHKPESFSPIDATRAASVSQNGIPNLSVAMTASILSYFIHTQFNEAQQADAKPETNNITAN